MPASLNRCLCCGCLCCSAAAGHLSAGAAGHLQQQQQQAGGILSALGLTLGTVHGTDSANGTATVTGSGSAVRANAAAGMPAAAAVKRQRTGEDTHQQQRWRKILVVTTGPSS